MGKKAKHTIISQPGAHCTAKSNKMKIGIKNYIQASIHFFSNMSFLLIFLYLGKLKEENSFTSELHDKFRVCLIDLMKEKKLNGTPEFSNT